MTAPDARFGRPTTHRGERTAFPQVRVMALAECGTRAITHATLGPFTTAESVLARELFEALGPDDLLMADRGFAAPALTGHPAAGTVTVTGRTNASTVGTLPVARGLQ
ncbi:MULTISPECIES: hypothetical protein [unclassified Streptomyces]|uniref:hypothetical protein n=1 Tax=unclassified Streptomyces TaxID=2593676 RepID=UPI0018FE51D4|nr:MULTISPECIES: hypothetical protein [unclassified Streptomyces]MCP3770112.1 hypothetical protein [Streptomyces sp. MAR25Y5]